MASAYGRNNYYRGREQEPKVVQLIPLERHITAVFSNGDGTGEFREPVIAAGLDNRGETFLLSVGEDGIFTRLDETRQFLRVEFC